jgi:DNA-directed RNA polymerase II subunit RPB11
MPHPLEHEFLLKIQTTPDTTPLQVLTDEINHLLTEIAGIMRNFEVLLMLIYRMK